MKVYAGAPAAARHYVESDRGRADDYYLAEGTGVARRFTAGPDGPVLELVPLSGDGYEAWVAGADPGSGMARGALRTDARGVRFVEVVVNGPKSWSLAAALHPDVAAAYDGAQDRAAEQVIGWLGRHATTRVGPRGGQVQVPVEVLEAVTVAHRTSRAGDPHRHLHLQINARVFAEGKWRGLHTVGVRDSLAALNGIGHAAVATDPQFRAALAAHGYSLNSEGEIRQLAAFVGPFSARAVQIARSVDRYEREWIAAHPGETAGPGLRRAWDARAWADGRPDKMIPRSGTDLDERWRAELAALGYRDRDRPVPLASSPVGGVDRDRAAGVVLTRLAAARSAWNAADVRGEVEQLIAAAGIVAGAPVRVELAEDLTARALSRCVPLVSRDGSAIVAPVHVRALTSQPVLDVEADLGARLAARATRQGSDAPRQVELEAAAVTSARRLDAGQGAVAAALAGDRRLVVVEGAAGAGKTTTLAAARELLEVSGRRQVVVTPTLKAAKVAAAETGARAGSAAWGGDRDRWRWTGDGAWTRLTVGQTDPVTGRAYAGPADGARLWDGDLLVVDEAGMLDQDTARALLTVADECQVRVALVGDRHQLPAVGRGGVLDLAVREVDADAFLTLDGVHRFTRTSDGGRTVPDTDYADLTLAMRTGQDPGAVFDALFARGHIQLHPDPAALCERLAAAAASSHGLGQRVAVVVDTREQAAELNTAIRDRLVAGGHIDDAWVAVTRAGERIGEGDRIATRRNDRDLGVANRDTWIVTTVGRRGELLVTPTGPGPVTPARGPVTPPGVGERWLPAGYVAEHVELAYASTAHGVQGDTIPAAHLVVGEHTGAASAYVGMTRGRQANTAHLIAADPGEAREQWIAAFARDRADLGPAHAAQLAAAEAARSAPPRPLERVLAELEEARSIEWRCRQQLTVLEPRREALAELAAGPDPAGRLEELTAAHRRAFDDAEEATGRAEAAGAAVTAEATRIRSTLLDAWHTQRGAAATAARVFWEGPGRFGLHRGAHGRATQQLTAWAQAWRPLLPAMPTDPQLIAEVAGRSDHHLRVGESLTAAGRAQAEASHPEHAALVAAAATAKAGAEAARSALTDARREDADRAARVGHLAALPDPAAGLVDTERELAATRAELAATRAELAAAQARIATLTAEPAHRAQPADQPAGELAGRRTRGNPDRSTLTRPRIRPPAPDTGIRHPRPEDLRYLQPRPDPGRGISR